MFDERLLLIVREPTTAAARSERWSGAPIEGAARARAERSFVRRMLAASGEEASGLLGDLKKV